MEPVCVTGIGVISAIGDDVSQNFDSLVHGRSGIAHAEHFQSRYSGILPVGEVPHSNEELIEKLGYEPGKGVTRTTLLALIAFREAIRSADLSATAISAPSTALISASTVGGMCETDQLYNDANHYGTTSPFVTHYEGADHTRVLAEKYGITGITDTINTACSSSANAVILGTRLIQTGRADRVIVGGSDSLAKFTVNGFNSLRILSERPSQPFDVNREGLNLGEAAAYLVLEKASLCTGKKVLAKVTGYSNVNDAFHPSATSDEATGPITAMKNALAMAKLESSEIDFISAHGTGTENNDRTEMLAIETIFGEEIPPYLSTKSYTGHTLAAAGSVEAVFSILALQNQVIFPALREKHPINPEHPQPVTTEKKQINHVISNAFGFGGCSTSLIFSKPD